jgi:hypothetical protein
MYGTILARWISPLATKYLAILLLVITVLCGGWWLHHSGYESGYAAADQKAKAEMIQYQAAQRAAFDKAAEAARKVEEELQTKLLQGVLEKENEIRVINDNHQRLVHGLRQRANRRPPEPVTVQSPVTTTFECTRVGGTGEELSREDGEFLVGEAASADILRQALKQCREAYNRIAEGAYKIQ